MAGVVLIMSLENIIREKGLLLKCTMESIMNVARNRRIAMAIP